MSEPREILPNTIYQVTRRCAQQQLLMRPDEETNNAFLYCLAEAAQRFDIGVLITAAMSNHHHTDIIDRQRNVSMFLERFHGMFAHCMNHLRGRSENFWSSEETSLVVLADPSAVISSVVYAATNPVKDGLVERVDEWPGVNGLSALLEQRTIVARRPSYFRADGPMPETVTLELIIPEELGDPDAVSEHHSRAGGTSREGARGQQAANRPKRDGPHQDPTGIVAKLSGQCDARAPSALTRQDQATLCDS